MTMMIHENERPTVQAALASYLRHVLDLHKAGESLPTSPEAIGELQNYFDALFAASNVTPPNVRIAYPEAAALTPALLWYATELAGATMALLTSPDPVPADGITRDDVERAYARGLKAGRTLERDVPAGEAGFVKEAADVMSSYLE
jgi:hypothetical protein